MGSLACALRSVPESEIAAERCGGVGTCSVNQVGVVKRHVARLKLQDRATHATSVCTQSRSAQGNLILRWAGES